MFIHTCGFVCMISDDLLGLENHLRDIKICRYAQKIKRMIKISSNTPHLKSDLILPLHRSGRFKIKEQLLERKNKYLSDTAFTALASVPANCLLATTLD